MTNAPKKAELLTNANLKIENLNSQITEFKLQKSLLSESVNSYKNRLDKSNKKLKFSANLNKFGLPISFGLGAILAVFLVN